MIFVISIIIHSNKLMGATFLQLEHVSDKKE